MKRSKKNVQIEDQNIYHCCIQKSGSQWIKSMFSDQMVYKASNMKTHVPHKNFFARSLVQYLIDKPLPVNKIITPLYIGYEDFLKIPKPEKYKAFFVMRDPRDILISWYFSAKFSHRKNPYIKEQRKILKAKNDEEAICYLCKHVFNKNNILFNAMRPWYSNEKEKEGIIVLRYEDLVGAKKIDSFIRLMAFINIGISKENIEYLLKKYSFEKFSRGRKIGVENIKSHYRKGKSGDWKNYFTREHKEIFKKVHGQLLIDLNYENDLNW